MVSLISKFAIIGVVIVGVLYQFVFKTLIFDTLGYGRVIARIEHFDKVRCEKITEPDLEACEHMWLHQPTGYLYMACSSTKGAINWVPAVGSLNASGRSLTDRVAILDTRAPGTLASRLKWLKLEGFTGVKGDGTLNAHGFDIRADRNTDTLRILFINHRPPFDPITGAPLDAHQVGANSTIEQFHTVAGSESLRYIRTYSNDIIETPNSVHWVNDHAFVFSNDHSRKVGLRRTLDPLLGGGSIGYCDRNRCNIAKPFGSEVSHPNGIVHHAGLIYLATTIRGGIRVLKFSKEQPPSLQEIGVVKVPYPIDNLSIDKHGDIFAATFPKAFLMARSFEDPYNVKPPSAVFKISRISKSAKGQIPDSVGDDDYKVVKVVEDDGNILPGSTVAVHDTETGRIFLGGVISPYIAICETR